MLLLLVEDDDGYVVPMVVLMYRVSIIVIVMIAVMALSLVRMLYLMMTLVINLRTEEAPCYTTQGLKEGRIPMLYRTDVASPTRSCVHSRMP